MQGLPRVFLTDSSPIQIPQPVIHLMLPHTPAPPGMSVAAQPLRGHRTAMDRQKPLHCCDAPRGLPQSPCYSLRNKEVFVPPPRRAGLLLPTRAWRTAGRTPHRPRWCGHVQVWVSKETEACRVSALHQRRPMRSKIHNVFCLFIQIVKLFHWMDQDTSSILKASFRGRKGHLVVARLPRFTISQKWKSPSWCPALRLAQMTHTCFLWTRCHSDAQTDLWSHWKSEPLLRGYMPFSFKHVDSAGWLNPSTYACILITVFSEKSNSGTFQGHSCLWAAGLLKSPICFELEMSNLRKLCWQPRVLKNQLDTFQ